MQDFFFRPSLLAGFVCDSFSLSRTVCASVGSDENKQQPEKLIEADYDINISSECPSLGTWSLLYNVPTKSVHTKRRCFAYIFQVVVLPTMTTRSQVTIYGLSLSHVALLGSCQYSV